METLHNTINNALPPNFFPSESRRKEFFEFIDDFDHRSQIFWTLNNDFLRSYKFNKKNMNDQYRRRTFIRTTYCLIEGQLNIFLQMIDSFYRFHIITLTRDEYLKTNEKIEKKNGKTRPLYLSLEEKTKFAFWIVSKKIGGFDYQIDSNPTEWEKFKIGIQTRNNITHPKTISDLFVSNEQMILLYETFLWFNNEYRYVDNRISNVVTGKWISDQLLKDFHSSEKH